VGGGMLPAALSLLQQVGWFSGRGIRQNVGSP
jgi:hypothetical protein